MSTPTREPRPLTSATPPPGLSAATIPRPRAQVRQHLAGENDQLIPAAGPASDPVRVLRLRPAEAIEVDLRMLVMGYLSTVAFTLDQRGFLIREVHAQHPDSPTLWGELTLAPVRPPSPGWCPARLSWAQNSGWSATLLPSGDGVGDQRRRAISRYLPAALAPSPITVAHFAAALRTDANTMWARATFRSPRQVARRWLILQLARFTMPEPW